MQIGTLDAKALSPHSLTKKLMPGDLLVSYPGFWKHWQGNPSPIPKGITLVSSTSPCTNLLKQTLFEQGVSSLVEIYGSNKALPAVERPKHFSFGDQLPTNEQGKLVDWPITDLDECC